eukprot:m.1092189 g.1092189  ORF g.1092189 m.1092189 type:complete len:139 (-) comp24292_c0_seq17:1027-1443(-)
MEPMAMAAPDVASAVPAAVPKAAPAPTASSGAANPPGHPHAMVNSDCQSSNKLIAVCFHRIMPCPRSKRLPHNSHTCDAEQYTTSKSPQSDFPATGPCFLPFLQSKLCFHFVRDIVSHLNVCAGKHHFGTCHTTSAHL